MKIGCVERERVIKKTHTKKTRGKRRKVSREKRARKKKEREQEKTQVKRRISSEEQCEKDIQRLA